MLVTTSRDPSSKLTAFAKEIALLLPGARTQNRGTAILKDLVDTARASSITDIVILHEHRRATSSCKSDLLWRRGMAAVTIFASAAMSKAIL